MTEQPDTIGPRDGETPAYLPMDYTFGRSAGPDRVTITLSTQPPV